MKFEEMKYERPNYEEIKVKYLNLLEEFSSAKDFEKANHVLLEINMLKRSISTMFTLCNIRYTINTKDSFYEKEQDFCDEYEPLFEDLNVQFYKEIMNSKFIEEIANLYGKQLLNVAGYSIKSFSKDIIEDLKEENKLCSEYQKLIASAKISFNGEEKTLSELGQFITDKNREVRKQASDAKYNFFEKHEEELDKIFDRLVKVRTEIAKKLGFKNFVDLGYIRMNRFDYNKDMVENFRKQVLEEIVPISNKLYERQRKRLGLDSLKHYDTTYEFSKGNPIPKGDADWIVENGKTMYTELSSETKEFFDFMTKNNLMDLASRKGKASGGYCTYLYDYESPFIFSNFNGTAGDVDVLTHEAGHAFQSYRSSWIKVLECMEPTYESCEIHSMSMEFFTWPWMNLFFKEDTEKYKFYHLSGAIKFIPYGVAIDEFQHLVYENPEFSPKERKTAWRNIEKKYLPHKDYSECDFLERGGYWFNQLHVFLYPFYYIDYTLAQICALQFWKKDLEDHERAWEDYLRLCSIGGIKPFQELVKYANLKSPFEDGCIKSIINCIDDFLEKIDDKNF